MKLFDSLQVYCGQKRILFLKGIITYSELIDDCESAVDFAVDLCDNSEDPERQTILDWWKNKSTILSTAYGDYK